MAGVLTRLTGFFESLPDHLRNHRVKIWIGFVLVLVFLIFGINRLKIDMALESWFEADDPMVVAFLDFRDNFGSDDSLYIVYKAKDGDVLSEASLGAVSAIQDELFNYGFEDESDESESSILEHIVEIKSLINVSYMEVDGDSLNSRDFIGDEIPDSGDLREIRRNEALTHKDYPGFYISKDSVYGGILIRTDFGTIPVDEPEFDESMGAEDTSAAEVNTLNEGRPKKYKKTEMKDYALFIDAINRVLEKPEYAEILEFSPVGNPVIMKFFHQVLEIEFSFLFMGTLILMLIALYVLFRSFSAVVWPVVIILLTITITLGVVGWIGLTMSMMISVLIMLVLVVGVADSIHILSGYMFFRKRKYDHEMALRAVMKKSGFACMLTSMTTAAGLLAMIFVPIPPIANFGISAAIGVIVAFLLTVILLPLLLDIWQPVSKKQEQKIETGELKSQNIQKFLGFVRPFSEKYPKSIVLIFSIIAAISVYGLSRVKVNSNMVELVKKTDPIYIAHILVDKVMGGTQSMEILLEFDQVDALKDPKVLNAMEDMQNYLMEEHPRFVVKTESLVNVVKNSYQVLNEDREEMYIIPQERRTLHQTLVLFDSANPDDRKLLVTDDYSNGRINVRLKNYGSIEYLDFFDQVTKKTQIVFDPLKANYPSLNTKLTGALPLMMQLVDYMSWAQVQSFGLALVVITIMLLFVFGSPRIGLIGMIPNIFPVAVTFGVMGFLDIPLDGDTLIIAPIVIGIAVDDTIHFLTHFRTEMLETHSVGKSIQHTIMEVGQAISFSTIILVLGFMALVLSSHVGMARFGYLTAIAFVTALLADILLLPALCVLLAKKGSEDRAKESVSVLANS